MSADASEPVELLVDAAACTSGACGPPALAAFRLAFWQMLGDKDLVLVVKRITGKVSSFKLHAQLANHGQNHGDGKQH